ncbi:MAG: hypothetical protein HON43_07520 [Alphaproteobacteria bacterium]|jgi:hypothetical protein|nr:hypothetical protein [Alphaproteobacteria bacterium]MBT5390239.1 hypothetical protein [Alphaproteobacteria bacterium]
MTIIDPDIIIVIAQIGDPQQLYEDVYCARGNMENRIKETQLDLFSDRTSCHNWWPNQLRLLLFPGIYSYGESSTSHTSGN